MDEEKYENKDNNQVMTVQYAVYGNRFLSSRCYGKYVTKNGSVQFVTAEDKKHTICFSFARIFFYIYRSTENRSIDNINLHTRSRHRESTNLSFTLPLYAMLEIFLLFLLRLEMVLLSMRWSQFSWSIVVSVLRRITQ